MTPTSPPNQTTTPDKRVESIVAGLTKAQRVVACRCADVADRFPCGLCGASRPKDCGVSINNRIAARDAINDARAAVNGDGLTAIRTAILSNKDADNG